ncbi:MAG: DUF721 domain-containing protein [Paracoccaceae bacterium]|uniref:DUF721 domain-containing protein n=1 Tax=Seohaeicola saemankumensis TaxID=481181 RepID=UPI001E4C79E3|nr:DUF721 domain-containing protein [Seohaeicola saemankumensis]MCD1626668.1 DUF721 domain-containing protein [Seohaeicola saemankumensis]
MAARRPTAHQFTRAATLLQGQIRRAGETRGFAVTRLLTHWPEIVGEDVARVARPVEVSYGRQGMGATLSVLTTGSQAPMLEMQKERLREKVNAVYGYNAIARIRITQTAPNGFAEGQADFSYAPKSRLTSAPDPVVTRSAAAVAEGVGDEKLRAAIESLARNVLSRPKQ